MTKDLKQLLLRLSLFRYEKLFHYNTVKFRIKKIIRNFFVTELNRALNMGMF